MFHSCKRPTSNFFVNSWYKIDSLCHYVWTSVTFLHLTAGHKSYHWSYCKFIVITIGLVMFTEMLISVLKKNGHQCIVDLWYCKWWYLPFIAWVVRLCCISPMETVKNGYWHLCIVHKRRFLLRCITCAARDAVFNFLKIKLIGLLNVLSNYYINRSSAFVCCTSRIRKRVLALVYHRRKCRLRWDICTTNV